MTMMRFFTSKDDWDDALDAFDAGREGEGTDRYLQTSDLEVSAERREFLEQHPWPVFRSQVEHRVERTETRTRLNWTLWFSGLAFASSMAVVLLLVTSRAPEIAPPVEDPIRVKGGDNGGIVAPIGGPVLHVSADGMAITGRSAVSPAAELKFTVDTGAYDHVFVLGVEQSGAITAYYPEQESESSLLVGRGRGIALPDSVVLDGSLEPERFVAVFSNEPLDWEQIKGAASSAWVAGGAKLQTMGALESEGTQEASVWCDKQP